MGGVGSLCIPDKAELGETYMHNIETPLRSETSKSLPLFVNHQIGLWQSFMYFCPFVPCMYYLAPQDFIYTEDLKSNQCTMGLSPLKSCIKEFWLNASLSPHFPSV